MPAPTFLLLFAAHLAFIPTNVYGWLLKWFYRPRAHDEEFRRIFPAQQSVGTLYLLQALELPYLIQLGLAATSATDPTFDSALLYANTFALLTENLGQMEEQFGRFKRGLTKCRDYIFNFLENPSIPSNDKTSEIGIRKIKIKTKNSGAFRTSTGADVFLNLISIVELAKKLDFLPLLLSKLYQRHGTKLLHIC